MRLHLKGWKRQYGMRTTSHSDRALSVQIGWLGGGRRSAVVLFFPEKEIHSRERGLPAKNCGEMEKIRRAVRERGFATRSSSRFRTNKAVKRQGTLPQTNLFSFYIR